MSRPDDVGSVGLDLYESLEPLAYDDENQSWALLIWIAGLGAMVQSLSDLVSDGEDFPGWSSLLDIDRCPAAYLWFLGLFVGVRVPVGTGDVEARVRVRGKAGQERGTKAAMIAAGQRHLTGTQQVRLYERNEDEAYQLLVVTRTSETPDSAATLADLLSQKPGGIVLTHETTDSALIDELPDTIDDLTGDIDSLTT